MAENSEFPRRWSIWADKTNKSNNPDKPNKQLRDLYTAIDSAKKQMQEIQVKRSSSLSKDKSGKAKMKYLNVGQKESYTLVARKRYMKKML